MSAKRGDLSARQDQFCLEYVQSLNATQAAIRAGYSKKTAKAQASRLLTNVNLKPRLDELMRARTARLELSASLVLDELVRLAKVDPKDLFDARGRLLKLTQMPEDARRAISSIECDSLGRPIKIRLWSKTASLELLGKNLKLFLERFEITDGGLASALKEARERRTKALKARGQ